MFTVEQQQETKMEDSLAVQVKLADGSPASRSQPDQMKVIGVPGEVLMPVVPPRMKERNRPVGGRIGCMSLIVFGTVTSLTG